MNRREILRAARDYLRRHPEEIGRIVRSAFGLRLGVPIDALRWLASRLADGVRAQDVRIEAVPPGLRLEATVALMGTSVRAGAVVHVERVIATGGALRVELRLEDVRLRLIDETASTPVAMLIRSGALDLSRPGDLIRHLPRLPPWLVEASGRRVVLDFARHPAIAEHPGARAAVELLTSLVTVHGVETDEEHLDVSLRALPSGLRVAARNVRQHVLRPGLRRARLLLTAGR
ncbi:MAG: hypothetical protein NZ898_03560 [Myxococcota bacterium]|nr:hypothetical protein [Myxococcota bacterium]MDW8361185.1 hypothetical protein [Myxococcales bacterium]